MIRRFLFTFALAAMMLAAAAEKYKVTFFEPVVVSGTQLKPGDYRLELDGDKVIIQTKDQKVEARVKLETAPSKFRSTSVRFGGAEGKYTVNEIRLGGTRTKLVFEN